MADSKKSLQKAVGKTMIFTDGQVIGPVLAVVKRSQDSGIYLLVDATKFFNQEVKYVVSISDVDEITDDAVKVHKDGGDHLRGMVYYAEDYTLVE